MTQLGESRVRQLVLLGSGPTHRRLLHRLARRPLPALRVALLAAHPHTVQPSRVPALITGQSAPHTAALGILDLAGQSGVRVLAHRATAIDYGARALTLENGDQLAYDLLSLDPDTVQDRAALDAAMPGAREHGLFVLPVEAFATLWPRVVGLPAERLRSLVVLGAGVLAVEIAFALRQRLPQCAISLVSGVGGFLRGEPERLQAAVRHALQRATINLLEDEVLSIRAGMLQLGCGADLVCDVPLIATEPSWPAWLLQSGLLLDGAGKNVSTDACLRASGHQDVFVAPDDAGIAVARTLHANLERLLNVKPLRPPGALQPALRFADLGQRRAVLTWHAWCVQGHAVWRLKQWRELAG